LANGIGAGGRGGSTSGNQPDTELAAQRGMLRTAAVAPRNVRRIAPSRRGGSIIAIGAIAGFVMLAAVMFATLRVDWSAASRRGA